MDQSPALTAPVVDPLMDPLFTSGGDTVLTMGGADVGRRREVQRRRRLWRMSALVGIPAALLWLRILTGHPIDLLQMPHIDWVVVVPMMFFVVLIVGFVGMQLWARRSPHIVYRPEQIDVRLSDVVGIEPVKEEVVRSINLFLSHKTFAGEMGGTPRRGLLFEGAPGTGKTHTAKAMSAEAGVPFLYVSGTSFQSMFYGATAGKIRSYFKELRKVARAEGGAIGFIEEIDAIGGQRGGMGMSPREAVSASVQCCGTVTALPTTYFGGPSTSATPTVTNGYVSEGVGGVVNELLVQMQSFDEPTGWQKAGGSLIDWFNLFLPAHRQMHKPTPPHANVLLIAATNRADQLDPALLRPGRFDRSLHFDRPDQRGRRLLTDHFLRTKAHHDELDDPERRDALASATQGYTPVMIEQLFDEGLVNAVRRGDNRMTYKDIEQARMVLQVGLGQPVGYTAHEKRLIATHEAGHATAAHLVAPGRKLEVLSIIKRREALGMLAHGDGEETYTRSRTDMIGLIQIALAGQCAEEIFFGDVSTGPAGDLLYATNVAAQMIGAAGMAGTLVSFAAVQGSAFSDTNIVGRVLGDHDGRRRVEELLQEQKVVVKGKLEDNQHLVAALRDALLDRNELVGREITDVLEQATASGPPPAVIDLRAHEQAVASERAEQSTI
ncbi:MAG TPA: AAA family ATPase [Mycobacteriales bacterium]|nr:AAA family ATPase [Mycobacteriales bacterium]